MAYYFTEDIRYGEKARLILRIWFTDDASKVNPNVNFGQGIPGEVSGRRAGIIEWRSISAVVTAAKLEASDTLLSEPDRRELNAWLAAYYYT